MIKMTMEYTSEEYEYAIRILHHRNELEECEVDEWMKMPEHLNLLEELAAIQMQVGDKCIEESRLEKKRLHWQLNRKRRLWTICTIAASVFIALGAWQMLIILGNSSPATPELTAITPGNLKATLILADGKVVDLHTTVEEIQHTEDGVIRNDSLEGLKYTGICSATEEYNVLQVPTGGFYKLELADGTKVWLNAQSELRYPVTFSEKRREVWLKGEGYFEVARDETRQFRVHLEKADVTVLGTSFNISAYVDEEQVYTTLVNGTVRFRSDINDQAVVLQPGKQSVMNGCTGKTWVREVDPQVYTAWREGRFVFRFMNLETIIRQLQRWYDFEVFWINQEAKDYEFRGVIQKDSRIEDVFKAIELATDVKFKITDRQVMIEKR